MFKYLINVPSIHIMDTVKVAQGLNERNIFWIATTEGILAEFDESTALMLAISLPITIREKIENA